MKIAKWLEKISYNKGLNIKTLIQTQSSKEIRIIMPKGEIMKKHQAPGDIVIQILLGKIWFEVDNKQYEFQCGDMLALEANIPHSLGGLEDSVIRLSLSIIDDEKRVQEVANKQ